MTTRQCEHTTARDEPGHIHQCQMPRNHASREMTAEQRDLVDRYPLSLNGVGFCACGHVWATRRPGADPEAARLERGAFGIDSH